MRVRMKTKIGGYRNEAEWPDVGGCLTVPDHEGRDLIAVGYAEEAPDADEDERAADDGDEAAAPSGDAAATEPGDDESADDGDEAVSDTPGIADEPAGLVLPSVDPLAPVIKAPAEPAKGKAKK